MWNVLFAGLLGAAAYFVPKKAFSSFGPFQNFGPVMPQPEAVPGSDLDVMARTIWGEARGEGREGMRAVANVIMNRFRVAQRNKAYAALWGSTIAQVCKKKYQFSVWLTNDPNYPLLLGVTEKDPLFKQAKEIARQAMTSTLADNTGGATFYHTKQIKPKWAQGETPIKVVGNHLFYTTDQIA